MEYFTENGQKTINPMYKPILGESSKSAEFLQCVKSNAECSKKSIEGVMNKIEDANFKQLLLSQYEILDNFSSRVTGELTSFGQTPRTRGALKCAASYAAITFRTLIDDSNSHIADMVISSNNAGMVNMTKELNASKDSVGEKAVTLANEFIETQKKHNDELKSYL